MATAKGTKKGGAKAAKKTATAATARPRVDGMNQTDAIAAEINGVRGKIATQTQVYGVIDRHPSLFAGTQNPKANVRAILQRSPRFARGKEAFTWVVVAQEAKAPKKAAPAKAASKKASKPAKGNGKAKTTRKPRATKVVIDQQAVAESNAAAE